MMFGAGGRILSVMRVTRLLTKACVRPPSPAAVTWAGALGEPVATGHGSATAGAAGAAETCFLPLPRRVRFLPVSGSMSGEAVGCTGVAAGEVEPTWSATMHSASSAALEPRGTSGEAAGCTSLAAAEVEAVWAAAKRSASSAAMAGRGPPPGGRGAADGV